LGNYAAKGRRKGGYKAVALGTGGKAAVELLEGRGNDVLSPASDVEGDWDVELQCQGDSRVNAVKGDQGGKEPWSWQTAIREMRHAKAAKFWQNQQGRAEKKWRR